MKKGNKIIYRVLVAFTTLPILLGNIPLETYAASFTHSHSKSCYKEVTKTCKDHTLNYGKETLYRDCPTCKCNRECSYGTYTDHCNAGLVPDTYCGYIIKCRTCDTLIDSNVPSGTQSHTYKVKEISCGLKDGSEVATVSAYNDGGAWTNGKVTVGCSVNIINSSFSLAGNPFSFNGGSYSGQSTYEVSENGNYSFSVKSSTGETVSVSTTVSNIDREAPVVSLSKSTDEWTETGLTITASASDSGSGLADNAYSFGGGYGPNSSMSVSANGTYSVTVIDRAGNTASASITITNIGKDPKKVQEEEERRRKEEEEKRKKEEEERRKKEEEEKRRKEEEEKRREDDEKRKNDEDKKKDDDKKADNKKADDKKKNEEKLDIDYGSININVYTNDVSYDDISVNDYSDSYSEDISANIPVKIDFSSDAEGVGGQNVKGHGSFLNSLFFFLMGAVLVSFAFFVFSFLNFVYFEKEGVVRPVALAKVRKDDKKMFVKLPSSCLVKDKKYKLYLSPWSKLSKGNRKLIIDVDGRSTACLGSDGKTFVYNG